MKIRKWIGTLLALTMMISATIAAQAATTTFDRVYVWGDSMNAVVGARKETTAQLAIVYIDNIYTANGNNSTYSKVKIAADLYTPYVVAEKGRYYPVEIPGGVLEGDILEMYAQGNTSWLDCQISGTWNAQ